MVQLTTQVIHRIVNEQEQKCVAENTEKMTHTQFLISKTQKHKRNKQVVTESKIIIHVTNSKNEKYLHRCFSDSSCIITSTRRKAYYA